MPDLKKTPSEFTSSPGKTDKDTPQRIMSEAQRAFWGKKQQQERKGRTFKLDRRRYLRVTGFFIFLFARILFWESFVRRVLGESFVARGRLERYKKYARQFRALAVQMGGMMIKVGQFISTRMDILPPPVIEELADLQDEVPQMPLDAVQRVITAELGPIDEHFAWFQTGTVAAASLGQVHRAQLRTGERVVVKVQRENIEDTVQTDLAAMDVVFKIGMRYKPISERVNLPALLDEFAAVLWEELDYMQEGRNAERFSAAFADDPGVYVPSVYWDYTTKRVLVLEDVTSIKIGDYDAITAAGISRPEVAQRLLDVYLRQIFEIRFFHADPHPGNLFVYPLPEDAPQARAQDTEGRPFYLIFVDFGMTGTLTDEIVNSIRKGVVAVFSQDVRGVLDAFDELGMFMPGADRERMEEAARVMFDRMWGLSMVEMADFAFDEMRDLAREFSDLIFEMPFQVPQNFLYLGRAMSILSGMCTGIDPAFDPWRAMEPYAERLIQDEQANTLDTVIEVAEEFARATVRLPGQLSDMLRRIDRGDITFKAAPNRTFQRQVNRIEIYAARGVMAVLSAGFTISAAILRTNGDPLAGWSFLVGAAFFGLMLLRGRRTLT